MTGDVERSFDLVQRLRNDPADEDVEELYDLLDAEDPTVRRNAVDGFHMLVEFDPHLVLDEMDRFVALLDDPDWGVRNGAASTFATIGKAGGSAIVEAAPGLAALLNDEHGIVGQSAIEALRYVAQADPETVAPYVEDVFPFLESEAPEVCEHAVVCLGAVSLERPSAITPAAEQLVERFREGTYYEPIPNRAEESVDRFEQINNEAMECHRTVRQAAGHAVYEIAGVEPDAIVPLVGEVADLADDPDPQVRDAAIDVLFVLADARPDVVAPHVETIAGRLTDDAAFVTGPAVQALAALAIEHPDAVVSSIEDDTDAIRLLLDRDEAPVRAAAATLFAFLADEDPAVIDPVKKRLHELTDDEEEYVREAAADALESGE